MNANEREVKFRLEPHPTAHGVAGGGRRVRSGGGGFGGGFWGVDAGGGENITRRKTNIEVAAGRLTFGLGTVTAGAEISETKCPAENEDKVWALTEQRPPDQYGADDC